MPCEKSKNLSKIFSVLNLVRVATTLSLILGTLFCKSSQYQEWANISGGIISWQSLSLLIISFEIFENVSLFFLK